MDPVWTWGIVIGIMLLLMFMAGSAVRPGHLLGKGIVHVMLGVFLLFAINVLGSSVDLYVPFNFVTIGIASLLGLPGVIGLAGIQWFIIS
jgi:inhibitor of the pro-sigma K processing machinery